MLKACYCETSHQFPYTYAFLLIKLYGIIFYVCCSLSVFLAGPTQNITHYKDKKEGHRRMLLLMLNFYS